MHRCVIASVLAFALLGAACDVGKSPPFHKVARSEQCSTCHMEDYEQAKNHVGKRPPTCEICHTEKAWHEKHFEHPFELTGKHETTDCFDCHTGAHPRFEGTSRKCFACHATDFDKENAKKPFHKENGEQCENCHLTSGWTDWTPQKVPPPRPLPPEPPATATPTALPTATATAGATGTTTAPRPIPIPIPRPTQRPVPTTVPTAKPVPTPPDVVTHPSRLEE